MRYNKKYIITALLLVGSVVAVAQSDMDALRFSDNNRHASTARSLGLGGAVSAVGADHSAILTNPAGLAQFKSSGFNLSLASTTNKSNTEYLQGQPRISNAMKTEISSINFIASERKYRNGKPETKGWVNYNFLIGYNKTADFRSRMSYAGVNNTSFTDYVASYVNGLDAADLDANTEQMNYGFYYFENMFWYAYLIDSSSNGNYFGNYDPMNNNFSQNGKVITDGWMNEFNLALAANYEHKVYFGMSLNVHGVNYSENNMFSERNDSRATNSWAAYEFNRELSTTGTGVSGRLGVMLRPNSSLRIGASVQTPKMMKLKDEYNDALYVKYHDNSVEDLNTLDKSYSYTLITPMRYGLQSAYFFGKKGFVSAELESVDYSTMALTSNDELFEDVNDRIANNYQTSVNFKLGGEMAIESFRLRGGMATFGSPLSDNRKRRNVLSVGGGIHERNWSFDLGIAKTLMTDVYVPYSGYGINSGDVTSETQSLQVMLTISNKF